MAAYQFSITLPEQMAQAIQTRVEAGDYASASEVIREAMRVWLQREKRLQVLDAAIAQGIAELNAGLGIPAEEVRRTLAERFKG